MVPQAPWSPTAHAFAYHQFSHVANFWKQGRQASFQLDALPGGQAKLNLSFQLPLASEVVPPPVYVSPAHAPQRPTQPLFPQGFLPKDSKQVAKVSSRRRKSYRRSVLHRATLATPTLPPPENGSLRQAAQACVQRLQAVSALSVSTPSGNKRPFPDSPRPSPTNHHSLSQRIRKDIQIGESEVESPEKEILRSQPIPENSPAHFSPCLKEIPSPVPLAPEKLSCVNCDAEFNPDHKCEAGRPLGFYQISTTKKKTKYRPNYLKYRPHSTISTKYRPQKFLIKRVFTLFTFKSWDKHILRKWGLLWNMRDFDEIWGILMKYRPFWCNIDHKFKNIDHLSKMVDYRPMVDNIDPVAALPNNVTGPTEVTFSNPSQIQPFKSPGQFLGPNTVIKDNPRPKFRTRSRPSRVSRPFWSHCCQPVWA